MVYAKQNRKVFKVQNNEQTKTVEGSSPFGEKRTYTFNLMNAREGNKLFHEQVATVVPAFKQIMLDDGIDILEVLRLIPSAFSWDDIDDMCKALLAGSTVEIDGKKYEVDETGIGDFTIGDPLELYCHLFWAINTNYPKYLANLFPTEADKE